MRQQIRATILALLLTLGPATLTFAQEVDDSPIPDDADLPVVIGADVPIAPVLFVRVLEPATDDVELPLDATTLTVSGVTLPGAVVSVDGQPLDVDDQGAFSGIVPLDEDGQDIDVVASDADGHLASTTLYVARGE
jgi:hypothetical protein